MLDSLIDGEEIWGYWNVALKKGAEIDMDWIYEQRLSFKENGSKKKTYT